MKQPNLFPDVIAPYEVEVSLFDTIRQERYSWFCRHTDVILSVLFWADDFHPVHIRKAAR